MAKEYKFYKFTGNLADVVEVYPDLPWKASAAGDTWVYDARTNEFATLNEGQFIYKVGDNYEVRDSEEQPKTKSETSKSVTQGTKVKSVEKTDDEPEENE